MVVAALPVEGSGVYLIRRSTPPEPGKWSYPGGYLELGETLEEAVARETLEETGLVVRPSSLLNVYSRPNGRSITVMYLAEVVAGTPRSTDEASEVRIFPDDCLPWNDLAFWSTRYALEDWLHARDSRDRSPRLGRIGPAR